MNDAGLVKRVDYAIADLWFPQQYAAAFDDAQRELRQYQRQLDRLLKRNQYGLIDFQDGVALLQQGVESQAGAIARLEEFDRKDASEE
jgi:hypothetical protein